MIRFVQNINPPSSIEKCVFLCLPLGVDSAVVGCCLFASMLLLFAPGVASVLLVYLPITLAGLKSSLLNEKGRYVLCATWFISSCVASSPWVAPTGLKLSCVSQYNAGFYSVWYYTYQNMPQLGFCSTSIPLPHKNVFAFLTLGD